MYSKVNFDEGEDEDIAIDAPGYTGNFFRIVDEKSLKTCSIDYLAEIIYKENKLIDIMRSIKDIDIEHNGYVTSAELDDILKICCPEQLKDKNLKKLFRPFASI